MAASFLSRSVTTITLFLLINFLDGAYSYSCPYDYPFYSCPQPGDPADFTTCCKINGSYQCCDTSVLAAWAVAVIAVTVFLITVTIAVIACACCPCCWLASRRRRSRYVVLSNEGGYPRSTTTTYVYQGQPTVPQYATQYPPPRATTTTTTYVKT